MSVASGTVTVLATAPATLIVPAFSAQTTGGPNRPGLKTTVTNLGNQVVYLGAQPAGGAALTQATGSQLGVAGTSEATVTLSLANIDALYGTSASGTQLVTWLQAWQ